MAPGDGEPAAVVLLVRDGEPHLLGPLHGPDHCDLGVVDHLLRVQLVARRFGWSLRITQVRKDLLELVELAGLRDDLVR